MTHPKPPVITIIGAGSKVFGFSMCTDLCQMPALKGAEVRLVDVDRGKLETMKRLFALVNDTTSMDLRLSAATDCRSVLAGSDYVIVSVAHDRINRWERDLEISRRHGIVEVQGECGGPGGLSLTLRNVPLILGIAREIERLAPKALVLNFSNPMTRVCRALDRYTKLRTVGLCHGILTIQGMLNERLGRRVTVRGCGINHFNWINAAQFEEDGSDAWLAVVKLLRKGPIPGYQYIQELFEVFGRIVAPDDVHIADFTHHWRNGPDGLTVRYHLPPKDLSRYRKKAGAWDARMKEYLSGKVNPMSVVKGLSGEGAIPIIASTAGLLPSDREPAVNIPNRGFIPNLPDGAIVEVPARVSRDGVEGERMDDLPACIRSLISRQLEIADLAVEAAYEGSYSKALQALALDPIVGDLQVTRRYLDDILRAHADVLPQFC